MNSNGNVVCEIIGCCNFYVLFEFAQFILLLQHVQVRQSYDIKFHSIDTFDRFADTYERTRGTTINL